MTTLMETNRRIPIIGRKYTLTEDKIIIDKLLGGREIDLNSIVAVEPFNREEANNTIDIKIYTTGEGVVLKNVPEEFNELLAEQYDKEK